LDSGTRQVNSAQIEPHTEGVLLEQWFGEEAQRLPQAVAVQLTRHRTGS
jgi:hypothetical protein